MGRKGVKCRHNKDDFKNAIIKSKGYIVNAARLLGLSRTYFHTRLSEWPDLREMLADIRNDDTDDMVTTSEDLLRWTILQKEQMPSIAQKSAMYLLDNHGKKYGYNTKEENDDPTPRDEIIKLEIENIQLKNEQLKHDAQSKTNI